MKINKGLLPNPQLMESAYVPIPEKAALDNDKDQMVRSFGQTTIETMVYKSHTLDVSIIPAMLNKVFEEYKNQTPRFTMS